MEAISVDPAPSQLAIRLTAEQEILRSEIRTARTAAELTAQLVVQQFEETDRILDRLQAASAHLHAVLDAAEDLSIIATDLGGTVTLFNRGAEALLGYTAAEAIGRLNIIQFHASAELAECAHHLGIGAHVVASGMAVFAHYVSQRMFKGREWTYVRRDGSQFPVDLSVTPLKGPQGDVVGYVAAAADITTRKRVEETLRTLATVDGLTEILNRRSFMESAGRALSRAHRDKLPASVLMLDVDRFKAVNDTYGHESGDRALCFIAATGRAVLRTHDIFGRYGGEEFAVLLPDADISTALTVAERLRRRVAAAPVIIKGGEVRVTISIGVTSYCGGEDTLEDMLRRADKSLYVAKENGRNRVETMAPDWMNA